ncbi:MAG: S8 family peptidase [Flavobacteriales bacterium]
MRALSLPFLFVFLIGGLYAQENSTDRSSGDQLPEKVRGELYVKVAPASGIDLPSFQKGQDAKVVFKDQPAIKELIAPYEITRIHCPFRTQDKGIQHTYKLAFEKNSDAKTKALIKALESLEYVNYAEPVHRYRTFFNPNDVHNRQEWFLDSIKARSAWDLTKGDSGVTIALVDDAFNITHPDLEGSVKRNTDEFLGDTIDNDGNGYVNDIHGWDAANQDSSPKPPDSSSVIYDFAPTAFSHGTHTSGIASGVTNNGTGIASIGFNTSIIPVRASNTGFTLGASAEAVDYAISANADIISMSFGGTSKDSTLSNMLEVAFQDSIVLIASAGNSGGTDTLWPAGMQEVLAVGSTGKGDTMSSFSQYGTWIDLVAPGSKIYSTLWEGDSMNSTYDTLSGTSMSCPMVAGVAGLMKSYRWWATPSEIYKCLKDGAKNIDSINPSYIDSMGAGRLNAYASLKCLESEVGIQEKGLEKASPLKLYPNPSKGKVRWEAPENKELRRVEVLDMTGRRLRSKKLDPSRPNGNMKLSELPENIYLLRFLTVRGDVITRKLSLVH